MHQAWGTCSGVAALIFLLLFVLTLRTSLQTVLLPEDLLGAEPLELVLQCNNYTATLSMQTTKKTLSLDLISQLHELNI